MLAKEIKRGKMREGTGAGKVEDLSRLTREALSEGGGISVETCIGGVSCVEGEKKVATSVSPLGWQWEGLAHSGNRLG